MTPDALAIMPDPLTSNDVRNVALSIVRGDRSVLPDRISRADVAEMFLKIFRMDEFPFCWELDNEDGMWSVPRDPFLRHIGVLPAVGAA